jgi:hypothetical protein
LFSSTRKLYVDKNVKILVLYVLKLSWNVKYLKFTYVYPLRKEKMCNMAEVVNKCRFECY